MPKKKKSFKSEKDDWGMEDARKRKKLVRERERRLRKKYKQDWVEDEWDA
jgi:hypothetical protein